MKSSGLLTNIILDLSVLMAAAWFCGCEVDSATQKVYIRPDSATLRYGESVTLTAYNGYNYTWSLQNEAWGTLTPRSGMMVTYKSLYDPASPQVQIVTVVSTFTDSSVTGSNAPQTATAYITHIPATATVDAASSN